MPPTATRRENATDFRPGLTREDGVLRGHVYYFVEGASSLSQALLADGLPDTGDPWDAELTGLKASRFTPEVLPGSHGHHRVRVEYREDRPEFGEITPAEGLRVTTMLEQSRTTENVDLDITLLNALTHDGSGVPKIVNAMSLAVTDYSTDVIDVDPLVELSDPPKVNAAAITLRGWLGSEQSRAFPAGQLLYAGFRPFRQGEFFGMEHTLLLRRDWKHRKYPVDANGDPSGGNIEVLDMYQAVDFLAVMGS